MMPQGTRASRREQRRAWRGMPGGRKTTRRVVTAYGRHQKARDRAAEFSAWCAARREADATTGEGTADDRD